MSRVSKVVSELRPSGIRDFFELVMGKDEVISLGVGEPDFATPWHIREAAVQALEEGYTNYTSNRGLLELRESIADHLNGRHGLEYDPGEEILVTTGVSEGLDLAVRALLNPGDDVVVPTPCYISYEPAVRMAGGTVNTIRTRPEEDFRLTPGALEEAVREDTRLLMLNYPANPTGTAYTKDQLEALAEVVVEHDLIVIADEIYADLTYGQDHVTFPSLPGARDRTVMLNGFSKSYAMTGFRVAYAAGPPDILGTMTKIHQYTMLCAPTPAQFAAIEALLNGANEVEAMRDEYNHRREMVLRYFRNMGLDCPEPQGAFYAFPSVPESVEDTEAFCRGLLEAENVAAVPGTAFGPGGERHVRISYATDRERLKEALERIERYVETRREARVEETGSVSREASVRSRRS